MILSVEDRRAGSVSQPPNISSLKLSGKENYICSIYLTGGKRYGNFPKKKSIEHLRVWAESLRSNGVTGIMFHNCFEQDELLSFSNLPVKFIFVHFPKSYMSGLYRFELYNLLINRFRDNIDSIFFTDSTDLDLLKNPFIQSDYDRSKIYIGCEPVTVGNKWMLGACRGFEKYISLVNSDKAFANSQLLNAGLMGGSIESIAPFIRRMYEECSKMYPVGYVQDMPILNYLAYTEFEDSIVYGSKINTVFTAHEKNNTVAWFRHK